MLLIRTELIRAGKQPGKPLTILADLLERHFPASSKQRRKSRKLYIPKDTARSRFRVNHGKSPKRVASLRLQAVRAPRWERKVLSAADYPIIGSLRKGAVRACALNLLTFYLQVTSYKQAHSRDLTREHLASMVLSESDDSEIESPDTDELADRIEQEFEAITSQDTFPKVAEIHAKWSADWQVYEEAARTRIPRTHHRGKPFGEALVQPRIRRGPKRGKRLRKPGKRLVRQLKENMHSLETIRKALGQVSVLLNKAWYHHLPELIAETEQARHLWRRDERLQRATRASRFARYTYARSDDYVVLDARADALYLGGGAIEMIGQKGLHLRAINHHSVHVAQCALPIPLVDSIIIAHNRDNTDVESC